MRGLILPAAAIAPILFFLVLGLINKKMPFRWANVFKGYLTLLFFGIGLVGHLIYPTSMTELIPPSIPYPLTWVYLTGVLELAFAVLLWTRFQWPTGIVIIVYLVLVLPFNIYGWTVAGNTPNYIDDPYYLWQRVPMQALFIAFAYYGTRPRKTRESAGQTA